MKQLFFFLYTLLPYFVLSQQVLVKTIETDVNNIALDTFGLDEIKILNTSTNKIEINLLDENLNTHTITTTEEFGIFKIDFELEFIEESAVFRKFITKRLNRASVIIKIPENKSITIYGDHIDVISESYQGDLNVYIDKGLVKLNEVKGNINLKLFKGNVFATMMNTNIDLFSNNGKIKINDVMYSKKYQKKDKKMKRQFTMHTINANITLQNDFKM